MKLKIHFFGQDDICKEVYKVVPLAKPDNPTEDKTSIKKELSDFTYEHLQDSCIRMVRRGQYLTLLDMIREIKGKGWLTSY